MTKLPLITIIALSFILPYSSAFHITHIRHRNKHLASSSSSSIIGEVSGNQREFDYFALALQWPGTYCRRTHKSCKSNGCCRSSGPAQHFTIHGLWADYNDGTWPSCCGNTNFKEKEIATLREALDEYWPTLSCGSTSTCSGHKGSFYAHEWEKHGTCSARVTGDEYNYFLTTLNIYFKYNVTEVLREAGYVPSKSEKYPLGGVKTAIENAFHTTPKIMCSGDAIQEMHLCFYKDFKPRDCAVYSGNELEGDLSKSSCPEYVSLPVPETPGRLRKEKTISKMLPLVQAQ